MAVDVDLVAALGKLLLGVEEGEAGAVGLGGELAVEVLLLRQERDVGGEPPALGGDLRALGLLLSDLLAEVGDPGGLLVDLGDEGGAGRATSSGVAPAG